jgi:hypothetical protein
MKSGDILKFAALFLLVLVVLYRKYGKKFNKKVNGQEGSGSGKDLSRDDDYEPYSSGKA